MKRHYFLIATVFILVLAVLGFSDNLFTDIKQKSNSDPKFIIHGLFMFAWFIILVIQTNFIRKHNYQAHIRWGTAGLVAAIGMVVSTFYVFFAVFKGWDAMAYFVLANRVFMLSFVVYVWLGYRNKKAAIKHKRYIYLGNLFLLEPILSRIPLALVPDQFFTLFVFVVWNGLFISFLFYDWATLRKIHPITWISYAWFYIVEGWYLVFLLFTENEWF